MRGDVELLQCRLEVGLVDTQPLDQHGTTLVEQHVVGVGGEQIGPLAVVVRHGDDRLAALLEGVDGGRHLLQFGEAGPLQTLGLDHQRLDAIVIPRALDGPQQIGEDDFAWLLVPLVHLPEQLHRGIGLGALLYQHTGEIEGERPSMGVLGVSLWLTLKTMTSTTRRNSRLTSIKRVKLSRRQRLRKSHPRPLKIDIAALSPC